MTRRVLPNRRENSETIRYVRPCDAARFGKRTTEYLITFWQFEEGAIAEVFVSCSCPTTEIADIIRDAAVLLSIGFQYGVPLETLHKAITRAHNETAATLIGEVLDVLHARLAEDISGDLSQQRDRKDPDPDEPEAVGDAPSGPLPSPLDSEACL